MNKSITQIKNDVVTALNTCKKMRINDSKSQPLLIIEEELEYLLNALNGGSSDRVNEINIGLLAVREIEPHELANQIYEALDAKKYLLNN